MVDWGRVEELRSKGWDWERIASDPKVGFHADTSAGDPGRALRALYHRGRIRERVKAAKKPSDSPGGGAKGGATPWTLIRIGYLTVPLVGIWFVLAYFVPSPIGLVVPALPYLGLVFAAVALVLIWALWRSTGGPRWSRGYRNTVIGGVVLGFVVAGLIGLTGTVVFGCPLLPPASSLSQVSSSGWEKLSSSAWHDGGNPVVYFYGATWCPFCSASSWAVWKALSEFGGVSGTSLDNSSSSDVYPSTPEIVLASLSLGPKNGHGPQAAFEVSEDTSGVRGTVPSTSSCVQQAYLTAYSTGIPFMVINGQYVHLNALVNPADLTPWHAGQNGGPGAVQQSVASESPAASGGNPWLYVQGSAWWLMAFLAKASGQNVSTLANDFNWSPQTKGQVATDVGQIP